MSITLTRDQAERCMREDAEFKVKWRGNVYTFSNGNVCRWDDASIAWVKASDWEAIGPWLVAPVVMVHSDPQGTYNELFGKTDMDPKAFRTETEQKYLTRPEALKALIRGERILATDDLNTELWLDGDVICSTLPGGHIATFQLFFTCDKYTLVPQPDSPRSLCGSSTPLVQVVHCLSIGRTSFRSSLSDQMTSFSRWIRRWKADVGKRPRKDRGYQTESQSGCHLLHRSGN